MKKPRYVWQKMHKAEYQTGPTEELIQLTMNKLNTSREETLAYLQEHNNVNQVWINDIYQVQAIPFNEDWIQLNIRRRDGGPILRDWRHFQLIKNDIVGEEHEGVELYPAESRLVDTANKFHLWVCTDPTFRFPWGWQEREVNYESGTTPGLRQRSL